MAVPGWSHAESPFHAGEQAIQEKLGVRSRIDQQGRRMIRDHLIEQHRQFFAQLPYITVGTVDTSGQVWASMLVGQPGFLSTPDPRTLRVNAQPQPGDPLHRTLIPGADIGLLGIELHTRRRNRLNGTISALTDNGFEVTVRQSFGNCPQYIQARSIQAHDIQASSVDDSHPAAVSIQPLQQFSTADKALIEAADTFFIATAYQHESASLASGVDVSHRGGKPGFVRVEGDDTLMVPDFSGNNHFNTLGNLALNPQAGLLFLDFARGDVLHLAGQAEVIWDGPAVEAYEGAERLLRFRLEQGDRVNHQLPLRWSAPEFSPYLAGTGVW